MLGLHLTEDATLSITVQATDTLALSASEGLPNVLADETDVVAVADTLALPSTESGSSIPSGVLTVNDILTTTLSEDPGIFGYTPADLAYQTVVDTCVVQVLTAPANQMPISVSDALVLALDEPSDQTQSIVVIDSVRGQASDTAALSTTLFTLTAADTAALRISETAPTLALLIFLNLAATDASTLAANDSVPPTIVGLAQLSVSDTVAAGASDGARAAARYTAMDTFAIQAVEPSGLFSGWGATDSLPVRGTDGAPTIAGAFSFNTTDSTTLQATESAPTFLLAQAVAVVESLTAQASEGGPLITATVRASETLKITGDEASSLLLKFLLVTDSLGLSSSDAAGLFVAFIQVAAIDSIDLIQLDAVAALDQVLTQLGTTDALTVGQRDDLTTLTSMVSSDDTVAGALSEILDLALTYALVDSIAFVARAENANIINATAIFVSIFADDSSAVGAGDVLSLPDQLLLLDVADAAEVAGDDVALSEDRPLPEIWDGHQGVGYNTLSPDPISYRLSPVNTW